MNRDAKKSIDRGRRIYEVGASQNASIQAELINGEVKCSVKGSTYSLLLLMSSLIVSISEHRGKKLSEICSKIIEEAPKLEIINDDIKADLIASHIVLNELENAITYFYAKETFISKFGDKSKEELNVMASLMELRRNNKELYDDIINKINKKEND